MNKDKIYKVKTIIIIALLILLIIFVTIVLSLILLPTEKKSNDNENIDIKDDSNVENNNTQENVLFEVKDIFEDENFLDISDEEKKLLQNNDNNIYLLLKQCMQNYHANNLFCIDEIYEEKIDWTKSIYNIYYRLEDKNSSVKSLNIFIKIDKKNKTFLIYPYEFIQSNKLLNLKQGDLINFDGIKNEIEKKDDNVYDVSNSLVDNEACMLELFQRYKFDLMLDTEKAYSMLDENYKNERFKTFEEFNKFVSDNKETIKNERISKYKVYNFTEYMQFMGISTNERNYIFNVNNLMDYTIILDNYSIDTTEYIDLYQNSMPSVQAKYCIDRVRKAINENNYKYVYDRLNAVQKNNYFKNYNGFETFLRTEFFKKNTFTIGEYIMISDNVFQYEVKVTDSSLESNETRDFTMTIILKNNTDYNIGIIKE